MPVIATPVPVNPTTGPSCANQSNIQPIITTVDGAPVYAKMQSVQCVCGQVATINYIMVDQLGNPVDLSTCIGSTVKVSAAECTQLNSQQNPPTIIDGSIVNSPLGLVTFTLTTNVVAFPGIDIMEVGIFNLTGGLIFSNSIYLIVNRGQFAASSTNNGPPTIQEIRLYMRDNDPNDNLWLNTFEFDMAEIAACMQAPIDYFNDSQPPLRQRWSTASFPWRYYYVQAIIGQLYRMASLHYARTHLPYQQQGGLMVDDKNKYEQYDKIGKDRWDEYKDWVLRKKVELNAWGAIQTVGSPYDGYWWTRNGW